MELGLAAKYHQFSVNEALVLISCATWDRFCHARQTKTDCKNWNRAYWSICRKGALTRCDWNGQLRVLGRIADIRSHMIPVLGSVFESVSAMNSIDNAMN
jgi:hypothetical protein